MWAYTQIHSDQDWSPYHNTFSKYISDVTINYNKFVWKFPFCKFYCIILFIYEFDFFLKKYFRGEIWLLTSQTVTLLKSYADRKKCTHVSVFLFIPYFLSPFPVQFLDNVLVKSYIMIRNIMKRTIYLQVMW